jgi:SNF2 family DNA or RNA helicase
VSLSAAYVTPGPLYRIEGTLPPHAINMAKRAGAFEHGGHVLCKRDDWDRVEGALKAAGVILRMDGTSPGKASLSLGNGGTGRIEGVLPRTIPKTWLGRLQGRALANITPYALQEAYQALRDDNVEVAVTPDYRKASSAMDDMAIDIMEALSLPDGDLPDVKLRTGALRLYQRRAMAFGQACRGRFYVADGAGVGKTLSAVGFALLRGCQRVLVVCPGSVKGQWRDEIEKFAGGEVFIAQGRRQERIPASTKWLITNPDILADRYDDFGLFRPDLIIRDEGHKDKSPDAQRTKALRNLAHKAQFYIVLTGTPIENKPIDAWVQLDILQPNWWGARYDFGLAFCEPERNHWASTKASFNVFDFKGVTEENRPILQERLRCVMIRRTTDDPGVNLELPEQTRTMVRVDLGKEAMRDYQEVVREYKALVQSAKDEKELEALRPKRAALAVKMRRVSAMGRIQDTVELVQTYTDSGDRVIVFGYYQETLEAIAKALKEEKLKVGLMHGGITGQRREDVIKAFKDGKTDVLVSSIAVGGVGLNFQHACRVTITHELSYTPIDIEQSEARVFRSGQTRAVEHKYVLGEGTMDERVLDLLFRKMAATKAFLDGGHQGDTEDEILREIESGFFAGKGGVR